HRARQVRGVLDLYPSGGFRPLAPVGDPAGRLRRSDTYRFIAAAVDGGVRHPRLPEGLALRARISLRRSQTPAGTALSLRVDTVRVPARESVLIPKRCPDLRPWLRRCA